MGIIRRPNRRQILKTTMALAATGALPARAGPLPHEPSRAAAPACLWPVRASWRTRPMNVTPTPIVTSPGSANAQRQPRYWAMTPVTTAEEATPKLPHNPLMPTWRPSLSAVTPPARAS